MKTINIEQIDIRDSRTVWVWVTVAEDESGIEIDPVELIGLVAENCYTEQETRELKELLERFEKNLDRRIDEEM